MFKKYPILVLAIIIATIGFFFVACDKNDVTPNTITYADEEGVNNTFNSNNTIKEDVKIEGTLNIDLFLEKSGDNICMDNGVRRVGYVLQDLSKKLIGYDILDGAKILTSEEIEEKTGILRENYDSMCYIEGNSKNPSDFLIILKVDPNTENYESKIQNAFNALFHYREELFEKYRDDTVLSTKYLSAKITKGNDYILFFSIGDFESDDIREVYNYYNDINTKLLNGYYYVLGEVYNTNDKTSLKDYNEFVSSLESTEKSTENEE